MVTKHKGRKGQCRGKCHKCGEEGHWAHKCHTLKEGTATAPVPTAKALLGATGQPETMPTDAAHIVSTIDLEGGSFWMVKEEATCMLDSSTELGLP
jgi:hypothetical protein